MLLEVNQTGLALIVLGEHLSRTSWHPSPRACRRGGENVVLNPQDTQAYYHLYIGKGHYILKNTTAAMREWQHALEVATAHGLTQTCVLIRSDIAALDRRPKVHG